MRPGKILILVPANVVNGGIRAYFHLIYGKFTLPVEYVSRGSRNWPYRENIFRAIIRIWKDIKYFREKLETGDFDLIQTNTSLEAYSVIRDGIYLFLARKKGIKIIVFYHGWNLKFERKIGKFYLNIFRSIFFKADTCIVLANQFKEKLIEWGYTKKIYVESTIVDENSIKGISEKFLKKKYNQVSDKINLLFLARVEVEKGIYETIEAFRIITADFPRMRLTIAGDGLELENVKKYVSLHKIEAISFLGHITGDEKTRAFMEAHLYILPSYTEGMPTSIVEAMAFGLPVISRPVGGICDLIINGQNGFIAESKDPADIAELIRKILKDRDLMTFLSLNNYRIAKERLTVGNSVIRLEKIYTEVLNIK